MKTKEVTFYADLHNHWHEFEFGPYLYPSPPQQEVAPFHKRVRVTVEFPIFAEVETIKATVESE